MLNGKTCILVFTLHIEPEVHDVPVLHHVVLAFHRQFAGLTHGGLTTIFYIVVVLDDLGADEAFLEVGVDDAGTLRGLPGNL